jgi:hypothetical protein
MNRGPARITVTTEVGFCSFCGRARNLRREERQLGEMVRTIVTCESCHRNLWSSMGVPKAEPAAVEAAAPAADPHPEVKPPPAVPARPRAKTAPAPKPTSTRRAPKHK